MNPSETDNEPILFQSSQHRLSQISQLSAWIVFTFIWIFITFGVTLGFFIIPATVADGNGSFTANSTVYKRVGNTYLIGTNSVPREQFINDVRRVSSLFLLITIPFWGIGIYLGTKTISAIRNTSKRDLLITSSSVTLIDNKTHQTIYRIPVKTINNYYSTENFVESLLQVRTLIIEYTDTEEGITGEYGEAVRFLIQMIDTEKRKNTLILPFLLNSLGAEEVLRKLV